MVTGVTSHTVWRSRQAILNPTTGNHRLASYNNNNKKKNYNKGQLNLPATDAMDRDEAAEFPHSSGGNGNDEERRRANAVIAPLPDLVNDEGFPVYFSDKDFDLKVDDPDSLNPPILRFGGEEEDDFEYLIEEEQKGDEGLISIDPIKVTEFSFIPYCGRNLGRDVIADEHWEDDRSNGFCGPTWGPNCPSCKRFAQEPSNRLEMLKRIFPALATCKEASVTAIMRKNYGNLLNIVNYLQGVHSNTPKDLKRAPFQPVKLSMALSARPTEVPPLQMSQQVTEQVQNLQDMLHVTLEEAELALRNSNYDMEQSADYLLNNLPQVRSLVASEAAKKQDQIKDAERGNEERNRNIIHAIEKSAASTLPDIDDFPLLQTTTKTDEGSEGSAHELRPMIAIRGHRMILLNTSTGVSHSTCVLCASRVPSATGGRYICQACQLCEGCIQTTYREEYWAKDPVMVAWKCPAMANGGHLHNHPMKFTQRLNCYCDMSDVRPKTNCPCNPALWSCIECELDFCPHCIANPAPDGFSRRLCRVITHQEEDGKEEEEEEEEAKLEEADELREYFSSMGVLLDSNDTTTAALVDEVDPLLSPPPQVTRQATVTAEREAAGVWEGAPSPRPTVSGPVVGTGTVGDTRGQTPQRPDYTTDIVRDPNTPISATEERLSDDAQQALLAFRSQVGAVAASDLTYAEDILRRAQAADNRLTNRAVLNAVATGRISIAGTLLLSQAYAPMPIASVDQNEDSAEGVTCWCGEVIDAETSPDGAVGCLGGHAMHPNCAADLLLGGGHCPTCRQPLFYSRLAGPEVKAAAEFAKGEIRRVQEEEKQRVQKEIVDMAKRGIKVSFSVGDIVLISPDVELCRSSQMEDPITGGWEEDMVPSCGLEGLVEEIVVDENGEARSIKVRSAGRHSYKQILSGTTHLCASCDRRIVVGNSSRFICRNCEYCDECCRGTLRSCPHSISDWFWSPSALTLLRRQGTLSLAHETIFGSEASAAVGRTERHILRLRSELIAVKKAREAVKEEADKFIAGLGKQKVSRELSTGSSAAVFDLAASGVSAADWQRARHLLLLARQWGNSKEAKEKRAALYSSVRNGDLDSVARLVRSYNVAQVEEELKWADAAQESSTYVVAPCAQANLRVFPRFTAPKTGFSLPPFTEFKSKREILDENGLVWVQVAMPDLKDFTALDGKNVTAATARVGLRVRSPVPQQRARSGVIIEVLDSSTIRVRWDEINPRESTYPITYPVFDGEPIPPPQGWLALRPCGVGSRAIASCVGTTFRCFGCGDRLFPRKYNNSHKYETAKGKDVKKGDTLLVAATLESVVVESVETGHVLCFFSSSSVGTIPISLEECGVWYRLEDLVLPNAEDENESSDEETVKIEGNEMSRHELFLKCEGDGLLARRTWNLAKGGVHVDTEAAQRYASCAKGHLLHARCFQGALVSGQSCPAPGCREPLWAPTVTRAQNSEDTCCSGTPQSTRAEAEALQAASELPGHDAVERLREAEGMDDLVEAGFNSLKMCPMCCSGPLFNNECSDMAAHHGQCSVSALREGGNVPRCTANGDFRVAASEIAAKVAQMSGSQTVPDVLPKCPTHDALVIFNGCMACGHLFTDTRWNNLPDWDPSAKALLEVDKKTRNAARLLTEQVRTEAALLQFERDALHEARGEGGSHVLGWGGSHLDLKMEPPPMPPPPSLPEIDDGGDY